jgi:sporulation protein YlmC with PRC-barrel domain
MQRSNTWSAGTIIGREVQNAAGEHLGKIEDLVIDPATGRIQFAILSFGGFAGAGDRLFAVPWESLRVPTGRNYYALDFDKTMLRDAPGFDRDTWPDMTDPDWQRRIDNYYGRTSPYTQRAQTIREREVLVEREARPVRQRSLMGAALMIVVLIGLLWFTYKVSTRGWDQAKDEALSSVNSAAYAMKETSADATLTAKVQTAYSLNTRIPGKQINVDSQDGVVTLRGEVASQDVRNLAETIAQDTPGVSEVRNHLYVIGAR